jgi:hypothetical protein
MKRMMESSENVSRTSCGMREGCLAAARGGVWLSSNGNSRRAGGAAVQFRVWVQGGGVNGDACRAPGKLLRSRTRSWPNQAWRCRSLAALGDIAVAAKRPRSVARLQFPEMHERRDQLLANLVAVAAALDNLQIGAPARGLAAEVYASLRLLVRTQGRDSPHKTISKGRSSKIKIND